MRFYLTDTKEYHNLTLRYWQGDHYTEDCFSDLNEDLPTRYPTEDGGDALMLTAQEFAEIVDFWKCEIPYYNAGNESDVLGCRYTEDDTGNGETTPFDNGEAVLFEDIED